MNAVIGPNSEALWPNLTLTSSGLILRIKCPDSVQHSSPQKMSGSMEPAGDTSSGPSSGTKRRWQPEEDAILLMALDKSCSATGNMPRAMAAPLSAALLNEFPQELLGRGSVAVAMKMRRMLDEGFTHPSCDIPDIDARIDLAIAAAAAAAGLSMARPQGSEDPFAGEDGSATHDDDSNNEQMVGCYGRNLAHLI